MSPASTMALIRRSASPEFVMVMVCGALGMANPWGGKTKLRGETSAIAAVRASNLVTKASPATPPVVWKEPEVIGKSEDDVDPVM